MSEKFDYKLSQEIEPGKPARVVEAMLIPEDMRKALLKVGIVPGKDVFVIATGISDDEHEEPIAYVSPQTISEGDLRDFNMEEFMMGTRFQEVNGMPLKYLRRRPFN